MKNEISPHYLIHFLSPIMHRMNQATLLFLILISSLNQKGDTLNVSYENVGWPLMHFCLKLEDVASLTKSVTLLFTFVPHLSSTLK